MMHADSNVNAVAVTVWAPPKTWSPVIVAGALRKLVNEVFDPYRPGASFWASDHRVSPNNLNAIWVRIWEGCSLPVPGA